MYVSRHIDVLVAGMTVGDINIICPDTCHTGKGGPGTSRCALICCKPGA
jgi:hypothetical protein